MKFKNPFKISTQIKVALLPEYFVIIDHTCVYEPARRQDNGKSMLHYMIYRVHKMKTFFVSGTECREKPFLLEFYNENECSEQCPSNSLRINARMNSLSCIWCPSMSANSMKFQRHNAVKAAPQKRLNDVLGTVL